MKGQTVKLSPSSLKAALFSFVLSLAIIMEGYDTSLLGSFYAYPEFQQRFGAKLSDGTYQVTSQWQSGLQTGTQVGQIIGLMSGGLIADRWIQEDDDRRLGRRDGLHLHAFLRHQCQHALRRRDSVWSALGRVSDVDHDRCRRGQAR